MISRSKHIYRHMMELPEAPANYLHVHPHPHPQPAAPLYATCDHVRYAPCAVRRLGFRVWHVARGTCGL
jgi:hypothetical protein